MRTIAIALFSVALMTGACKKKEAAKTEAPKPAEATKPAEAEKPAEAPKPAEATPPAAAAFADEQKVVDVMVKLGDTLAADGKDCKKLTATLTKASTENKALFDAWKAFEATQTPEQKKATEEKYKAQMEKLATQVGPAATACKDNKEFNAALALIPQG